MTCKFIDSACGKIAHKVITYKFWKNKKSIRYAYMVHSDTNIHKKVVILTSSAVKSGFSRAFDIFPDVSFPSKIFHFEPLVWGSSKPLLGDFVNAESATRSPRSMESLVILPVSDKFSNSAWAVWCFSISSLRTPLTGLWTLRLGS